MENIGPNYAAMAIMHLHGLTDNKGSFGLLAFFFFAVGGCLEVGQFAIFQWGDDLFEQMPCK
jgi:hypothetical protein